MGISSLKVLNSSQNIIYKMIAATFALLCLTQVALGASESESQFYGQPGQFGGQPGQFGGQYPGMQNFYSGDNSFQLRKEDQDAIKQLGSEGVNVGTKGLKIANELLKGVFPATGPVVRNGEIQTKWGYYALPNPQDAEIVDKLLQATRDLISKMSVNVRQ